MIVENGYTHNHNSGNDFTGRHKHPKLPNSMLLSCVHDIGYN